MIPEYSRPRESTLYNRCRKLGQDRARIIRGPLAIELVASKNNKIWLLCIQSRGQQIARQIISVITRRKVCVPALSMRNRN